MAQLWWRALLGALGFPGLQAAAFSTGVDLLLDPDHSLPQMAGFHLPGSAVTTVMNLFMVACLLMVTARIPRLVARYALHQNGTTTAGVVVRTLVMQAGLRRLGLTRLLR